MTSQQDFQLWYVTITLLKTFFCVVEISLAGVFVPNHFAVLGVSVGEMLI